MPDRVDDLLQCHVADVIGKSSSHGTMSRSWTAALATVYGDSPPGYASTVRLMHCDTSISPSSPDAATALMWVRDGSKRRMKPRSDQPAAGGGPLVETMRPSDSS